MKHVLIVDDERTFLRSLGEGLAEYNEDFVTYLAEDGQEAVDLLRELPVDVVVTDLRMPRMDGFALLAHLSRHNPGIPVIVMTAFGSAELRENLRELGTFGFMDKPLDFSELVDLILRALDATSEGHVRGLPLPAYLQLVATERKTCTLTIRSHDCTGYLFFKEGELVDANDLEKRGEPAAYTIVCWQECDIEIDSVCRSLERTVNIGLQGLLMDAHRLLDENNRDAMRQRPAPETVELDDVDDEVLDFDVSPDEAPGEQASQEDVVAWSAAAQEVTDQTDQSTLTLVRSADPKRFDNDARDASASQGPATKEAPMAGTKEILNMFTSLEGVRASCLVGRDGFLLDSDARQDIDPEMIGAIAATGFGSSDSMGRQLGKGSMVMTLIEYESGPVLLSPVGEDGFVVIVADKAANFGMIRLSLKKHASELAARLAA